MSEVIKPTFMVNLYDSDGDLVEEGIWLCFETTMIKVADGPNYFGRFVEHLDNMIPELTEAFNNK